MKPHLSFLLAALPVLFSCAEIKPISPVGRYVVAVDTDAAKDANWMRAVSALRTKYRATVLTYSAANLESILPGLRRAAPRYVCFVAKPERAGRALVVAAAQLLRQIDDDPYGDALWGIVTGYDASDALRLVSQSKPLVIQSIATSMGGPHCLDDWKSGFASNESNRNDFWSKVSDSVPVIAQRVEPDPSQALANAFRKIPVDYWATSGHASERNWQIIYNQNAGSLVHQNGNLFFSSSSGKRHPLVSRNPKLYLAAGNCLIGNIDRRDCMATAWIHSGGVTQMLGYTVPTFYGFMGWGTKSFFETGRYSAAEAFFLNNQILLWVLGQSNAKLRDLKIDPKGNFDIKAFLQNLEVKPRGQDETGMIWDRDTVAFYGDPAWRVTYPEKRRDIDITHEKNAITLRFLREVGFPDKGRRKDYRPVAVLLDTPPPQGAVVVDAATGKPLDGSVATELFALIPLAGNHRKGETLRFVLRVNR